MKADNIPFRLERSDGELRIVGRRLRLYVLPDLTGGVEWEVPVDQDVDAFGWSNVRFDPGSWCLDVAAPSVLNDEDVEELAAMLRWAAGQPLVHAWVSRYGKGRCDSGE